MDGASGLSKDLRAATRQEVNKAAQHETALPWQPQADTRETVVNAYGPRPTRLLPIQKPAQRRGGSRRNVSGSCRSGSCRNEPGPRPTRLLPNQYRPCRLGNGSCNNEPGPRPKRLLPKRIRPPAEAAPAEAIPAPGRSGSCRSVTGPAEAAPAEFSLIACRPDSTLPGSEESDWEGPYGRTPVWCGPPRSPRGFVGL